MRKDIYNIDRKLQREISNIKALKVPNSELLLDFKERYCIKNKLTETRSLKLLNTLNCIIKILNKPLNRLKEKDFEAMNIYLAKKGFTRNTINDYRTICKIWLRFLSEKHNWDLIHSKELKAIPTKNGDSQLDPDLLPSDEEVIKLFNVLPLKYKAFLATIEGAGLRCSEAATLLRKNVHFDKDGSVTINYIGKTGRNSIKIHKGLAFYIAQWANQSPFKDDEAPFFPNPKGKNYLAYTSIRKQLIVAAKKIGILGKRKVNAHIFRHRHASWCLMNMPPVLAKKRIWNNASTKMDKTYGHFTKTQENEAYDIALGLKPKEKDTKELFKQRVCFKCSKSFPPTYEVCPTCSIYLDPKKISEELQKSKNLETEIAELKADMEKILVFLAKEKGLMLKNTANTV